MLVSISNWLALRIITLPAPAMSSLEPALGLVVPMPIWPEPLTKSRTAPATSSWMKKSLLPASLKSVPTLQRAAPCLRKLSTAFCVDAESRSIQSWLSEALGDLMWRSTLGVSVPKPTLPLVSAVIVPAPTLKSSPVLVAVETPRLAKEDCPAPSCTIRPLTTTFPCTTRSGLEVVSWTEGAPMSTSPPRTCSLSEGFVVPRPTRPLEEFTNSALPAVESCDTAMPPERMSSFWPGALVPRPILAKRPVPVMFMFPVSGTPGEEPCKVTAPPTPPMRLVKAPPFSDILNLLEEESKYIFPCPPAATAGVAMPRSIIAPSTSRRSPGEEVPRPVLPSEASTKTAGAAVVFVATASIALPRSERPMLSLSVMTLG